MKLRLQSIVILICLVAIGSLSFIVNAQEQDPTGLIVSPPFLLKDIEAGVEFSQEFTVINNRVSKENIVVLTRDVETSPQVIGTGLEGDELQPSYLESSGWITISPSDFQLNVGQVQKVQVTVDIPEGLNTQAFFFQLAFVIDDDLNIGSGPTIGFLPEIAIPISINYLGEGEVERDFQVLSFEVTSETSILGGLLHEYLPLDFLTGIKNNGNVNLVPLGEIFISRDGNFSSVEESLSLNPNKLQVLSKNEKQYVTPWDTSFITLENGSLKFNWDNIKNIRIGQYYAQLNLIWDSSRGKQFITRDLSFWIIPWKLILAIIIAIALIIVVIRKFRLPKLNGRRKRK